MKQTYKLALHLVVLCIAILLPVIIYDYLSEKGKHDYSFIGGLIYFTYTTHWISKIKHTITKITLWSIVQFIFILYCGAFFVIIKHFKYAIPALLIINLLFFALLLFKNPKSKDVVKWKAFLLSLITTCLLSILGYSFWVFTLAISALSQTRY